MARPVAITNKERETFVLPSNQEDDEDDQVRFTCRPLSASERYEVNTALAAGVRGEVSDDGRATVGMDSYLKACRKAVLYALVGWENMRGDNDEAVAFPKKARRAIEMLPPKTIQELGTEIMERNKLTEEDAGN